MIKIYKTFELSEDLWQKISDGFNESFENHHTTAESLKNSFCVSNQLGYGYHAIDFDSDTGEIRGFNTYSPTFYKNGMKAFVSGSTFVRKKFRKDIFIFGDLITALRKKAKEDGFHVEIGVPNNNSREYARKFLKMKYVADLDYYILPRNLSVCLNKPILKFLDFFIRPILDTYLYIYSGWSKIINAEEKDAKYSLIVNEEFHKSRFKSSNYQKYIDGNYVAYFKLVNENQAHVAYLMDFRENNKRTKRALIKAIRHIVKLEHPDAVMFVGFLRLKQNVLFRVPRRFIPKPLPLTYFIIDKENKELFSGMDDVNNWNFSLMNFDVR